MWNLYRYEYDAADPTSYVSERIPVFLESLTESFPGQDVGLWDMTFVGAEDPGTDTGVGQNDGTWS